MIQSQRNIKISNSKILNFRSNFKKIRNTALIMDFRRTKLNLEFILEWSHECFLCVGFRKEGQIQKRNIFT